MSAQRGCSEPECPATYANHEWGAKKAQRDGWFLQKGGTSWCPEHVPAWVAEWRQRQASRTSKQ